MPGLELVTLLAGVGLGVFTVGALALPVKYPTHRLTTTKIIITMVSMGILNNFFINFNSMPRIAYRQHAQN